MYIHIAWLWTIFLGETVKKSTQHIQARTKIQDLNGDPVKKFPPFHALHHHQQLPYGICHKTFRFQSIKHHLFHNSKYSQQTYLLMLCDVYSVFW